MSSNLLLLNCIVLLLNAVFYIQNKILLSTDAYFLSPLDHQSAVLLDKTFRAFVETMQSANITFFVFSGTLIGSVRHHARIPWDDDIDVLVNITDVARLREALSRTDSSSFGFYEELEPSEKNTRYQWKFYPNEGVGVYRKGYKYPYVDIFFFYENETHIWNGSPYFLGIEVWQKSHVFPLHRRPFGDIPVPVPCNVDRFLGENFNISTCQSRSLSHYYEMTFLFKPVIIPCEELSHLYPFVHRTFVSKNKSGNYILETLKFQGAELRQVRVQQPC